MSINNGGPAFPTVDANRAEDYGTYGMTLRDYFAAKAMQAIISSDGKIAQMCKEAGIGPLEAVPIAAYSMADAMLEMREKM